MTDRSDGQSKKARKRNVCAPVFALILSLVLATIFAGCDIRRIDTGCKDGAEISAANPVVDEFCVRYFPGKAEELRDFTDMYYPEGFDLYWTYDFSKDEDITEEPRYAVVLVSQNEDLSDARRYVSAGTGIHVDDLLVNTDYFWQVEAHFADRTVLSDVFKIHTAHHFRTYFVPDVSNTRDLGGYSTSFKKTVRQGMIIRGANLDGIHSEAKKILLGKLNIRTDLDLRAPGEGKAGGKYSPLGESVNYVNISAPLYLGIKEEDKQEALASEIRVFTNEENYPIYFHCAIGRDRTGTLALLLLGLLGVPEDMIERDYEMSFLSYSGSADETPVELMLKGNYVPTVDYLNTFEGRTFADKVVSFLKSIGITQEEIDAIRNIMLR